MNSDTLYLVTGPAGAKAFIKATEVLDSVGACVSVRASVESPAGMVEVELDRKAMTALYYALGRALAKRPATTEESAT